MSNYFDYWLPIFKRMYFKFKLLCHKELQAINKQVEELGWLDE